MAQLGSGPLGQYTSAGGIRIDQQESETNLEAAMDEARWRLGGLRVAPYFGIRRATYQDNVFAESDQVEDKTSDVTVGLGAGFDAYLKTGSHVFYRFEVQPEYVYWLDLDERNQINGRYSAGAHAFFNRLTLSLVGRRYEVEQIVTPEFAQPVTSLREGVAADLRLRLGARIAIGVGGDVSELRNRSESEGDPRVPEFRALDRRQSTGNASLIWTLPNGIEVGAGWQVTEAEFDEQARALSASGEGPLLSMRGDGNRVDFALELFRSTLEPEDGSIFEERDAEGGRLEANFDTGSRISLAVFGQRSLLFSIDQRYSDFVHQRYGMRLRIPFGDRTALQLFGQLGDDDYHVLDPLAPARNDDEVSWGAHVELPMPRALPDALRLRLGYRRTDLDSTEPAFDRDFGGVTFDFFYSFSDQLLWQ